MKYGILFDLDGTLWDASRTVAPAWNEVMAAEGLTITRDIMRSMMGKTLAEIGAVMLSRCSAARQKALTDACSVLECARLLENGADLYPAVEETLRMLKKHYFLAVVSNCQIAYMDAFLRHYHFEDLFDDHLCAGDTGKSKGENIASVVRRAGLDRAIYVGDTQSDFDAAQAAGTDFLWAGYGFGKIDRETEKLTAFGELPDAALRILGGQDGIQKA